MKIRWPQGERLVSSASLLLQLIVILATARSCGWLLRFLGQPGVVGEMVRYRISSQDALGPLAKS
jgi:hypothetical protein